MKLCITIFALCVALAVASQVSPASSARDIYNYTSNISPPNNTEHKGGGGDGGGGDGGGGGGGHGGDDGDGESGSSGSSGSGSSGHAGGGSNASTLRDSNALLGLVLLLFATIGL
jgi:hypothetical protein